MTNALFDALRHHVTGAIERGEKEAITEQVSDLFRNKDGSLSPYAFSCGYIQRHITKSGRFKIDLFLDGDWQIKVYNLIDRERVSWFGYDTLTEARKELKREIAYYENY